MKKGLDFSVYLADIRESILHINEYIKGSPLNEVLKNDILLDAIIRRLLIVGEAVKKLPNEIRDLEPGIPWRKIAGSRDVFIHEYKSIIPEQVGMIISTDLPILLEAVKRLEDKISE